MKLLVTYNIPREPFQNLPADWEITFPEKEEFSKTELLRILPDYDIMLAIFMLRSTGKSSMPEKS